ncbi:uncharacterized protein H6S33_007803 [Morchella sextelata]|uniref:uncharacterized protein n=1 Tax=Morchella sextelata TaxID=1174677 RepID=UPI001D043396|nr:uncharacterized protein H6S33_007803 [Morchella sextelata]KAH0603481.1 hypothetical protein H6S33_007803 [Morchella sextelata]
MEPIDEWSVDANEALTLSLHSPSSGEELSTFHPKFTYPIFGESETIFGYRNLNVRLAFAADSMSPCLDVSWDKKKKPVGEVVAEDVEAILQEYLPEEAFKSDLKTFQNTLANKTAPFTPPGSLLHTSTHLDTTYEIWHANLSDPLCQDLLSRIQILILLFIEGGTFITLDDDEWSQKRWDIFFLYAKSPSNEYSFIGYSTVYRYYYFSPSVENLARARLSQFLILPPYQRQGHGSRFYDALIAHYLEDPATLEITVEDPSESFADLRDLRDLGRLQTGGAFKGLTLTAVSKKDFPLEAVRKAAKMPERQFARCVEMALLQDLQEKDGKKSDERKRKDRNWKMFRLVVKGRIYKQNRDTLAQLDRLERIDKLEETYFHVEDEYKRLLESVKNGRAIEDKEGIEKRANEEEEEMDMGRPKKKARV